MSDPDHFDDDDLVSSNPNQRNWRGILIALLVILAVLALIVMSVVLLTPPTNDFHRKGHKIKLQDIVGHDLLPFRINGSWISGNELFFRDEWGSLVVLNASDLASRLIMPNTSVKQINPTKFTMSADQKYVLLVHNVKKIYRYSYTADYSIYDTTQQDMFPLLLHTEDKVHNRLIHAEWAPRGHALVLIHEYDIYYKANPRDNTTYRVTRDAMPGQIYNGVPDWLYEEEILSCNTALWFAPDAHRLLYINFNDSTVEEQSYQWYGSLDDSGSYLYPKIKKVRYPKAGTNNPIATLYVADLHDINNIKVRKLIPPIEFSNTLDYYITAATWVNGYEASVVWLNRLQNTSIVSLCKLTSWHCQETHRILSDGKSWVEVTDPPMFSPDGNLFLILAPVQDAPTGYYKHIVTVNVTRKSVIPLTLGKFTVNKIIAWDHSSQLVYFLGVPTERPGEMHLYCISSVLPKETSVSAPHCLTCPASPEARPKAQVANTRHDHSIKHQSLFDTYEDEPEVTPPTVDTAKKKKKPLPHADPEPLYKPCTYHNVLFSTNMAYFLLECLGPGIPTVTLYATYSRHENATSNVSIPAPTVSKTSKTPSYSIPIPKALMVLQNNTKLYEKVTTLALPVIKTFPVIISGGNIAQVRIYLPPILREQEITRYPLVLQVYGGPGTQLVTDRWKIDWSTYLASARDYIVVQVDGRGSSGQGYKLQHQIYKKLGAVEVADQLEVVEYLQEQLHFIDKRRLAVWGWSYGGFIATMLLSSADQKLFNCGVAVSPVVSWKLYDSAYTERYLGMPNMSSSYKAYHNAELTKRVHSLHDKMLYLVHGTADDNVHLQQSMLLAKALSEAGIIYRQQIYPDENHSLSGVKRHLYRSMSTFLDDCFRKQLPSDEKAGLGNGGGHEH